MNQYKINHDLLQSLVNYLAKQPYEESAPFIDTLKQLEKIEEDNAKVGSDKDSLTSE